LQDAVSSPIAQCASRAFEATARNGSVSKAARELNVSAGAISRHIALLESDFGCHLPRREARGMKLTERGVAYFKIVSQAFESIDQGSRHLRNGTHSTPGLSIVLYSAITTEWLAPRIRRFHALHPSVELHLSAKMQTGFLLLWSKMVRHFSCPAANHGKTRPESPASENGFSTKRI
jgi:DNA-binding transcriptional LysR family regulator